MPDVLRILDANANRAREAMRVMEEAARFILQDAQLTATLKELRHDFAAALSALGELSAHRDTPGDVGTDITTTSESNRPNAADVVLAAGKRLSEALRVIEEYAKLLDPAVAAHIEALRYRGYDVEQRLDRALVGCRARQWKLCVLVSENLCPDGDWQRVATAVVEAGGDCIQLREKRLEAGELLLRARWLVELCRPRGVSVIINDRPDVALAAAADGVHLGQDDLPVTGTRKLAGRQLLIGVSTGHLEQAHRAVRDGADYCGVGPMFATSTKHKKVVAGPAYLKAFLDELPSVPHLAIGGITPDNVAQLVEGGCRGVAVSSAVCAAADPQAAAEQLLAAFG